MIIRSMIAATALLQIASLSLATLTALIFAVILIGLCFQEIKESVFSVREWNRIFNASTVGICLIDKDFKIRRANDSLLKTLGLDRIEAVGKHCYQVLQSNACLTPKCPLIRIMSGESSFETEEYRETDGAELTYSITTSMLRSRGKLIGIVKMIKDVTERKRMEQALTHTATHDALTDLPNRALFYDRVSQAIARTKRTGKILAVLFIDLDGFKEINDSFGHETGDQVLRTVAGRLKSILRDTDTVARLGGDEFVVLINEISTPDNSIEIIQKIMEVIQQPIPASEQTLSVEASIGLALYPEDGEDGWTLIRHADIAMYRAKKSAEIRFQRYTNAPVKIVKNGDALTG